MILFLRKVCSLHRTNSYSRNFPPTKNRNLLTGHDQSKQRTNHQSTMKTASVLTALLIHSAAHQLVVTSFAFKSPSSSKGRAALSFSTSQNYRQPHKIIVAIKNTSSLLKSTTNDGTTESSATEISKAPTLNGKMVLPLKAMLVGLKGHKVAAVYAVLNKNYKRG